jgi:hypothetical protein
MNHLLVRVIRTANRPLHEVEASFARETAPAVAADVTIAVGAESIWTPANIVRGLVQWIDRARRKRTMVLLERCH